MYRYDEFDHALVRQRVAQFRGQVARRLSGDLTEEQFRPLRLMNGLYLQLHAYMLRVAIPYGTLSSAQMRRLAHIARRYDRGYGHFTTRQNIQYNWPGLEDVPDILSDLADVEMHAIQTSGNCIRNVTADHCAGAIAGEAADPRVWSEIIRQWSSLHPEFSFLPRKFKIAVTGSAHDRAAVRFHDIGLIARRGDGGGLGFEVLVGGGLGRTPMIGKTIRPFVPEADLLSYLEAILRVYNLYGRRDNKYKARIKILVHERGLDEIRNAVEKAWAGLRDGAPPLPQAEIDRIAVCFAPPPLRDDPVDEGALAARRMENPAFAQWLRANVMPHWHPAHAIAEISLKAPDVAPGDITAAQMEAVADLAARHSHDEIRATHEQNLILPHVRRDDLFAVWKGLADAGLATANAGLISDMIVCPGLDYCALANARSIPVGLAIARRFADMDRQHGIGDIKVKISGCINACGHHHVGHIGILGVDRRGEEYYQITLGGSADENAALGARVGPAFAHDGIVDAVETVVETYIRLRDGPEETFLAAFNRLGMAPFKESLYAAA